ncbi:hypothetical protein LINPERPRIM_LOCUS14591 [Linum perenne]
MDSKSVRDRSTTFGKTWSLMVIEKRCEKLQSVVVAQFIGPQPPLRVFAAVAQRLWGYEEPVLISITTGNYPFNSGR